VWASSRGDTSSTVGYLRLESDGKTLLANSNFVSGVAGMLEPLPPIPFANPRGPRRLASRRSIGTSPLVNGLQNTAIPASTATHRPELTARYSKKVVQARIFESSRRHSRSSHESGHSTSTSELWPGPSPTVSHFRGERARSLSFASLCRSGSGSRDLFHQTPSCSSTDIRSLS